MAIYTDDDAAVNKQSSFRASRWLLTLSEVKNIAKSCSYKTHNASPRVFN